MRKVSFYTIRLLATALLIGGTMALTPTPAPAQVAIGVAVAITPPELPVYVQPVCPGDDYIWTPGYWAWDPDDGYYWVPGTWVLPPEPGLLWTPGYWAWGGNGFVFTAGYWGPIVGFYGGINYGFGYYGHGYEGGRWERGHFFYNRDVSNVNVTIVHNTYESRVINENRTNSRVSFNGGNGGVNVRPTAQEEVAARERHFPRVAAQTQHIEEARSNRELRASVNHGAPPIAATPRPGDFRNRGVVGTREAGAVHTAPERPENRAHAVRPENNSERVNPAIHPRDLPTRERPAIPNTGNPRVDRRYEDQQNKLIRQQESERQRLQQQQDREHQKLDRQQADAPRRQQVEQRHQQQTQQLQQRHVQQMQKMEQRQQPKHESHPSGKPH